MRGVIVLSTVSERSSAQKIIQTLLKERLAACVNLIPRIASYYWWKGKIQSDTEILLLIKTTRARLPALQRRLMALHPYEVPEVIALSIGSGSPAYLRWLDVSTKAKRRRPV